MASPALHCRVKSPALLPVAFLGLFSPLSLSIPAGFRSPCPRAHPQPPARHPRVMIPRSPRRPSRLFLPLPPLAPRSLKLIPGHVRPLIFPTSCLLSRSSTCLCGKGVGEACLASCQKLERVGGALGLTNSTVPSRLMMDAHVIPDAAKRDHGPGTALFLNIKKCCHEMMPV